MTLDNLIIKKSVDSKHTNKKCLILTYVDITAIHHIDTLEISVKEKISLTVLVVSFNDRLKKFAHHFKPKIT